MTQVLLVMVADNCRPTAKASRTDFFPESGIPPAAGTATKVPAYSSPAVAIAHGWRLIAPPVMVVAEEWEWWLEREATP